MYASAEAMDRNAEAAERLRAAHGGPSPSGGAGGGGAGGGAAGGKGGGALDGGSIGIIVAALRPLTQIGGKITEQMNKVGGTITTLARRIDNAIKFPALKRALDEVQAGLKGKIAAAAGAAEGSLTRFQKVTLALGPAASKAISAYRGFTNLKAIFGSLGAAGDVAKRPLESMNKLNFAGPASGAGRLATQFRTVAPVVQSASTAVKGFGVQLGLALGVFGLVFKGTQALVGFFGGGIKGAMTLGETMSKTKEVFGGSTDAVVAQAGEMAKSFGLPKGALLDAASSFGLIAQGAGQSEAASAGMANGLAKLAADASSFYNVPLETSLEKIRSGLVGEAEPLRAFGVLLSETAVKAEAHRLGLDKGSKVLSESAKVTARASLITRGLETASGDLARTQNSAANQFRKSEGGLGNFATAVGSVLMPAVESGIQVFNDLLAATIEVFENNKPLIDSWVGSIKAGIGLAGSVVRNFGDYWELAKLSAVQQISNILAYIETIPTNLALIGDYIAGNWRQLIADALSAVGSYIDNMATNYANLFTAIQGMLSGKGWEFEWTPLLKGFEATAAKLPQLLAPNLVDMSDQMGAVSDRIAGRDAKAEQAKLANGEAAKRAKAGPAAAADKGEKYKGTAAAELGSKEAASAVAKFRNSGGDDKPAQETAVATKDSAVTLKAVHKTLQEVLKDSGTKLSAYTL